MAQQQLEELHLVTVQLVTVQYFLRIMGVVGVCGGELCLPIHAPYSHNIVSLTCHLAMSKASHEVTYDCHYATNAICSRALYWLAHHISNWTKSKFKGKKGQNHHKTSALSIICVIGRISWDELKISHGVLILFLKISEDDFLSLGGHGA